MRKLKWLLLLFLIMPAFGQQVNQDIVPASSGLNLGHTNQRWNAYLNNINISGTCTINGLSCLNGFPTTCAIGQTLSWTGTVWKCSSIGVGTITGVTTATGSGLQGGGTGGTLNMSLIQSCSTNQILQWSGTQWICAQSASIPGGTSGQIQTNNGTIFGAFTASGDATINTTTGVVTVTKTNGIPFGAFATAPPASPPAIGGTTPAAGSFTTLNAVTGFQYAGAAPLNHCLIGNGTYYVDNSSCGSGGTPPWNTVTNPNGNQSLTMGTFTTSMSIGDYGASPGTPFTITDTASSTTDTSDNWALNTGATSRHNPLLVQIQNIDQIHVCWQPGPQGEIVFGSANITCPNISQSPFAKTVFKSSTASHTIQRVFQGAATPTGTMLEWNFTSALASAFNVWKFNTGCSATDTETGCTTQASLRGDGLLTVPTMSATTVTSATVNATTGYQLAGAAPTGHCLVGNGTNYVDSTTCGTGGLPSGPQGLTLTNLNGATSYATSAASGFDSSTNSGADRCAAIHGAWFTAGQFMPDNALNEQVNGNVATSVLTCSSNPFPVSANYGGLAGVMTASMSGSTATFLPASGTTANPAGVGQQYVVTGCSVAAYNITWTVTTSSSSQIQATASGVSGLAATTGCTMADTEFGGEIELPDGALQVNNGLQLGINHVSVHGRYSGEKNVARYTGTNIVPGTFATGNGTSFNPFLFALGMNSGYLGTGTSLTGPFGTQVDHVNFNTLGVAGIGGVSICSGQENSYVKDIDIWGARTVGLMMGCGTSFSVDGGTFEGIYIRRPNAGQDETNTTLANISAWSCTANTGSAPGICTVTWNNTPSAIPGCGQNIIIAGSATGSTYNVNGTFVIAAMSDASNHINLCNGNAAGVTFSSGAKQIAFLNNTSVADSSATIQGTVGFYTAGVDIDAIGNRSNFKATVVSNITDYNAGAYPACEVNVSGVALHLDGMHVEEAKDGICVGIEPSPLNSFGGTFASNEVWITMASPQTNIHNCGIHLFSTWGPVLNFHAENDFATGPTNPPVDSICDDNNSNVLTTANNPSPDYRTDGTGAAWVITANCAEMTNGWCGQGNSWAHYTSGTIDLGFDTSSVLHGGAATFTGTVAANKFTFVGSPYISGPCPGSPMSPTTSGSSAIGVSSDCNWYVSINGAAITELAALGSANTWTAAQTFNGQLITGTSTKTANYTGNATADSGNLIIMNCSSACTYTLNGSPVNGYWGAVESIGSTVATVSLNSKNFNGAASVPVLIKDQPMVFWSDGTNYFGQAPLVAGTNVTLTAASNGLTVASSGGGSTAESSISAPIASNTITETAAGDWIARNGVETANLTAPWSFGDANSTNNNTNIGLLAGVSGTSTGGIAELIYDVSGTGDILRAYSGGSVTSNAYTVGTLEANITAGGVVNATTGFEIGAAAPSGHYPRGNGTNYIDGTIANGDLPGSGSITISPQSQTCTLGSSCTIPLSAINPQTATYQVLASDFSAYKTITVSSGTFTITLVASGSQPAAGQYITVLNYGVGVVTIARSGQNINGGTASIVLNAGSALAPTSAEIWSNGTNYFATIDEGTIGTITSISTTSPITGGTITSSGTIACATCVTSAASLTANQAVNGSGSQGTATGFSPTSSGTITSGKLACYTASNTVGNCTGTPSNNIIGVFNSATTWIASGETSVTLDATVNVTFGDILCASSSAGVSHDNGANACANGEWVGIVKTTASSVSSATAMVILR